MTPIIATKKKSPAFRFEVSPLLRERGQEMPDYRARVWLCGISGDGDCFLGSARASSPAVAIDAAENVARRELERLLGIGGTYRVGREEEEGGGRAYVGGE